MTICKNRREVNAYRDFKAGWELCQQGASRDVIDALAETPTEREGMRKGWEAAHTARGASK